MHKVGVSRKQPEIVPNAELRNQGVDRTDLNTALAAAIADLRGGNVILPVRYEKREGAEALDDL